MNYTERQRAVRAAIAEQNDRMPADTDRRLFGFHTTGPGVDGHPSDPTNDASMIVTEPGSAAPPPAPEQVPPAAQVPQRTGPKPDPSQGSRGGMPIAAQIQGAQARGDWLTVIRLQNELASPYRRSIG